MGWLPIESAPRSGAPVLAWCKKWDNPQFIIWNDFGQDAAGWELLGEHHSREWLRTEAKPAFWLPVPVPPDYLEFDDCSAHNTEASPLRAAAQPPHEPPI
jgi:hypothetical protein